MVQREDITLLYYNYIAGYCITILTLIKRKLVKINNKVVFVYGL